MRWALGLAAIGALSTAAAAWGANDLTMAGLMGRIGAILAAIWLAYPAVVKVDRRTVWILVLGVAVVALRPRSAIVVLPVIAIFARTAKVGGDSADG
jgi:hypothetical protein